MIKTSAFYTKYIIFSDITMQGRKCNVSAPSRVTTIQQHIIPR